MKIWLIQIGEPLPLDGEQPRLLRTGLLAGALAKRGHRVTWWAGTFYHQLKRQRFASDHRTVTGNGVRLILMNSPGYARNASLARLRDHTILGRRFRELAQREEPPDAICCSFPTIELSYEAARYGQAHGVPVVLDARDKWPDIFAGSLPALLRPLVRPLIAMWDRKARSAFGLATAVTGHTQQFVDFGLAKAGRQASPWDRSFPFGYPAASPRLCDIKAALSFWRARGVVRDNRKNYVCFFGSFGVQAALDLPTMIDAARICDAEGMAFTWVFCGDGPRLQECRERAGGSSAVILAGWIDAPKIWALVRLSRVGILPYEAAGDFAMSIPNKAIEYLAGGLPIVTCLDAGPLADLVRSLDLGEFYKARDPRSLVEAVTRLIGGGARLQKMRERALAVFHEQFSAEKVYDEMARHIEEIGRLRIPTAQPGPGAAGGSEL